jgi:hypothetical protein
MTDLPTLPRADLFAALGGNARLVAAFEDQRQVIAETQDATTTGAEATQALQDARVLTLSPNDTFTNERVLKLGPGIKAADDGTYLILSVNDQVAHIAGGFRADLTAQGATTLVLPLAGTLATTDQDEILSNKTLEVPLLAGLKEYANAAAAAAGGVPINGPYLVTGSDVLHVRRS